MPTLVKAAQDEAGAQMTAAWKSPPTKKDRDVPLGTGYPRPQTNAAKQQVLTLMKAELRSRRPMVSPDDLRPTALPDQPSLSYRWAWSRVPTANASDDGLGGLVIELVEQLRVRSFLRLERLMDSVLQLQ